MWFTLCVSELNVAEGFFLGPSDSSSPKLSASPNPSFLLFLLCLTVSSAPVPKGCVKLYELFGPPSTPICLLAFKSHAKWSDTFSCSSLMSIFHVFVFPLLSVFCFSLSFLPFIFFALLLFYLLFTFWFALSRFPLLPLCHCVLPPLLHFCPSFCLSSLLPLFASFLPGTWLSLPWWTLWALTFVNRKAGKLRMASKEAFTLKKKPI